MIDALHDDSAEAAIDVLAEGFPRPREFWADCVQRIRTLGGNAELGLPLGYVMRDKGAIVGVVLIIGSSRPKPGGGVLKRVNFASWTVKPAYRWKAPLMVRAISKLPVDVITDLTASNEVQRILPTFGFKPITRGIAINLTPASALIPGAPSRLTPLQEGAPGDPAITRMLLDHAQFGCLPLLLSAGQKSTPLMLKMTRWRKMKTARVVYCGDNALLRAHVGAISAYALGRGAAVLLLDLPLEGRVAGLSRPGRNVRFAIGAVEPESTDYAGSELAVFDL